MSTKRKLIISLCSICLVAAIVVIGVFAFATQTFAINNRVTFTATDVKARVLIKGTNPNNKSESNTDGTIMFPNGSNELYSVGGDYASYGDDTDGNEDKAISFAIEANEGSNYNRVKTIPDQRFAGQGEENKVQYVVEIENMGDTAFTATVSDSTLSNLKTANMTTSVEYKFSSGDVAQNGAVVSKNEKFVVTFTYILEDQGLNANMVAPIIFNLTKYEGAEVVAFGEGAEKNFRSATGEPQPEGWIYSNDSVSVATFQDPTNYVGNTQCILYNDDGSILGGFSISMTNESEEYVYYFNGKKYTGTTEELEEVGYPILSSDEFTDYFISSATIDGGTIHPTVQELMDLLPAFVKGGRKYTTYFTLETLDGESNLTVLSTGREQYNGDLKQYKGKTLEYTELKQGNFGSIDPILNSGREGYATYADRKIKVYVLERSADAYKIIVSMEGLNDIVLSNTKVNHEAVTPTFTEECSFTDASFAEDFKSFWETYFTSSFNN